VPEPDITFTKLDRASGQRVQPVRRELGLYTFGMNLITLQPGQRNRVHLHKRQEEAYLVLDGELTLIIEAVEHVLGPDDVVRIGASVRRQLVNASNAPVSVIALGGIGEHEARDALAWRSWDDDGPGADPQDVPLPDDLPQS
jgi:uncharacterized cupin superfamily protein